MFWTFFGVILAFIYVSAQIITSDTFVKIEEYNCPDNRVTDHNRCLRWDLSKNKKYTSKVSDLKNENKFLLVKLEPSIKDGTVEGTEEYELPLNFDYKYTVKDEKGNTLSSHINSLDEKVVCNPRTNLCEEFNIIYDANISESGDIFIEIETRLDNWNKNLVGGFNVRYLKGNPDFVKLTSLFKSIGFIFSVVCYLIYKKKLSVISEVNRVIEQKIILNLAKLLIIFNDPLFAFTLYKPSSLLVFSTSLSITSFMSYLIYFWLVYFERIFEENDLKSCKVDRKWKSNFSKTIFVVTFISYFLHNTMNTFDPGLQITESYTWIFNIFKYISIMLIVVVFFKLGHYILKIWIAWPGLMDRHKTTFLFSSFFLFALLFFLMSMGELTYFETSRGSLLVISLSNLYIATLMYLFTISDEGLRELNEIGGMSSRSTEF